MEQPIDFAALAETSGVEVLRFPLPQADSVSCEVDGHCYIGLDSTHTRTEAEEQARIEVRADRWYIRRAIPRRRLFELLRQGCDAWEIAERLNTTEDYVRRAYYYYKENP